MTIMKLNTQLLDETNMLQIDLTLHNLYGQSGFPFLVFCLKDFRLSQFFIVSGKSDYIFELTLKMLFIMEGDKLCKKLVNFDG